MGKTHEASGILQQIRSKLDEARALSRSLGTGEDAYDLGVTVETIIKGLHAHNEAVEGAGEPHAPQ